MIKGAHGWNEDITQIDDKHGLIKRFHMYTFVWMFIYVVAVITHICHIDDKPGW